MQGFSDIVGKAETILESRHQKYGRQNISRFGEQGVVIRLSDKIERLINMTPRCYGSDETVEDTYFDIINYAVIGLMIRRGQWPPES